MSQFLGRVRQLVRLIENGFLTLLLTGMVVLGFLQIALRNLADISFSWGDPMLRVLVLWLGLVGAIAATRDDNHIRIDLLSRFLPHTFKRPLEALINLFSAAICLLIGWHAALFVMMEKEDATVAFSNIPTWILESIIPLGFCVIGIRFAVNAIFPIEKEERS